MRNRRFVLMMTAVYVSLWWIFVSHGATSPVVMGLLAFGYANVLLCLLPRAMNWKIPGMWAADSAMMKTKWWRSVVREIWGERYEEEEYLAWLREAERRRKA